MMHAQNLTYRRDLTRRKLLRTTHLRRASLCFTGWLGQLDSADRWLKLAQQLADPEFWTVENLVASKVTHRKLLQEYQCVEGVPSNLNAQFESAASGALGLHGLEVLLIYHFRR